MCHVYVDRYLDKHLASLDKSIRDSIKQDLKGHQLASSPEIFSKAVSLFNQKKSNDSGAFKNFLKYFNKQWIGKFHGWNEGFAPGIPSSNNELY